MTPDAIKPDGWRCAEQLRPSDLFAFETEPTAGTRTRYGVEAVELTGRLHVVRATGTLKARAKITLATGDVLRGWAFFHRKQS